MIRVNESVNFGLSSTSILIPCDNIIKKYKWMALFWKLPYQGGGEPNLNKKIYI